MEMVKLAPTFGCRVTIRDPRDLEALASSGELQQLIEQFLLVVLDSAALTVDQLKSVGMQLGNLIEIPQAKSYAGEPLIQEVLRSEKDNRSFSPFASFHVDSPFRSCPPRCVLMTCIETPDVGGDTVFSDMRAAYDDLSDGFQQMIARLTADYSAKYLLCAGEPAEACKLGLASDVMAQHRLVNSEIGTSKSLFFSESYFVGINGWALDESLWLMRYLRQIPRRLELQYRLKWTPGMTIIWDNIRLQHTAVADVANQRRLLRRVSIGSLTERLGLDFTSAQSRPVNHAH